MTTQPTIRALTLWQPWAPLWCSEAKVHETRSYPTMFRASMAVHAGLRAVPGWLDDELDEPGGLEVGQDL